MPKREIDRLRTKDDGRWKRDGAITVQYGSSSYGTTPLADRENFQMYEYMRDTVNCLETFSNPCIHDKTLMWHTPLKELTIWDNGLGIPITWSFNEDDGFYIPQAWELCRSLPPGVSKDFVADFCHKAEHHFKTAIDVEVLGYNFIIDTVMMTRMFKDIGKQILHKYSLWKSGHVPGRNRRRRDFFRGAADNWLLWNFAIKPYMNDLRKLSEGMRKVRKRIAWLRKHNGHQTRVRFRMQPQTWSGTISRPPGAAYPKVAEGQPQYLLPADTTLEIEYEIETQLSACAGVLFDIDTAFLFSKQAESVAYAVYSGLLAFGSSIWEAVPYSFVVDWFLPEKLKEFPNYLDYSPFPDATVHVVAHGQRSEAKGQVYLCTPPATELGPPQRALLLDFEYRAYIRQDGYPQKVDTLFRIPWSGYTASLAAALVVQKRRKRFYRKYPMRNKRV